MEYLVSNNKLDDIIYLYITSNLFKDIKEKTFVVPKNKSRSWVLNDKTIVVLTKRGRKKFNLWIDNDYWNFLSSFFTISDNDVEKGFRRWAINNLGLPEDVNILKL